MRGNKAKLSGAEDDVFTGWRRVLCYTSRAGVCKRVKQKFHRKQRAREKLKAARALTEI